ncbi:MAG: S8/S53 family peptidase [Cyanobacteria bacterium]|nr:S8/S53 family peptidase [Cyanobacteriota bacterium]
MVISAISREVIQNKSALPQKGNPHPKISFQGADTLTFSKTSPRPNLFQRVSQVLALSAGLGGLFATLPAQAGITPESDKVVAFVNKAWDGKAFKDKDWNTVRMGLRVSATTQELDLHPMRVTILEQGPLQADIPADVVQTALFTAGELGQTTKDLTLKASITQLIAPYADNVLIDYPDNTGKMKRVFVDGNAALRTKLSLPGSTITDLRKAANAAIGKIANPATLDQIASSLLSSGSDSNRAQQMLGILSQAPDGVQLPQQGAVETRLLTWVFNTKNLQAYEEAQKKQTEAQQKEKEKQLKDAGKPEALPLAPNAPDGKPNLDTKSPLAPLTPNGAPGSQVVIGVDAKGGLQLFQVPNAQDNSNDPLLSPKLPDIEAGRELQIAQSIRFLAAHNNKLALPAAYQWFYNKGLDKSQGYKASPADFLVLEALGNLAQKDPKAMAALNKLIPAYPDMMAQVLFVGNHPRVPIGSLRDAGQSLMKALVQNTAASQQLIRQMATRTAPLPWEEPKGTFTSDRDVQDFAEKSNKVRDAGRRFAMAAMVADITQGYAETLKSIASNRFDPDRNTAIIGLALSKDTTSLDLLMGIAMSPTESAGNRGLALEAALYALTPDDQLPEITAKARQETLLSSPIAIAISRKNADQVNWRALAQDSSLDILTDKEKDKDEAVKPFNFFHARIQQQFQSWLKTEEAQRGEARNNGLMPEPISDQDKLAKLTELYQKAFGRAGMVLDPVMTERGKQAEFQTNVLAPMVQYLKSGASINPDLALPMVTLLGKSGYTPAAGILADIAKHPERFIGDNNDSDMWSLLGNSGNTAMMKVAAVQALGNVATPNDPNTQILHDVLRDPFIPYQFAGLSGLTALGERSQARLAMSADAFAKIPGIKGSQDDLRKSLDGHITKALGYIQRLDQGFTPATQQRRPRNMLRYEAARTIDALGGTPQLISAVKADYAKNPQSESVRSMVQAMISNGKTPDQLAALGLDRKIAVDLQQGNYWLGDLQAKGYQGEGGEHAHFDVGYVNPLPGLKDVVVYPQWVRYSDTGNWEESHPTGTASTVLKVAPKLSKIYSYSVAENRPIDPQESEMLQDPFIQGLEQALENQMTGATHITTTNHSWGYPNIVMYGKEAREQMIDLAGAYLEALGQTGVTNFVSAGNAQGASLRMQYDPVGTQNTLGTRIDKDGKVTQPNSAVLVAAVDGLTKWLTEFSSMPNPLRLDDALRMYAAPGYQEMTMYKNDDNQWVMMPVDGTSFSSPNLAGLKQVADRARANKGLPAWNNDAVANALKASSAPLPGRESWESGLYVDPTKFLLEALK